MRFLITTLFVLVMASGAIAEKPVIEDPGTLPPRIDCPFEVVMYDWDFSASDQGFTLSICDATGGEPVWEWGAESHFGNCWGTALAGNYPANAGEALVSPTFTVTDGAVLVQVTHYFDTELTYDGCNLMVNDTVVTPMEGYTLPAISPSTTYYAFCVEGEPGFSGHGLTDWVLITSCFDLSDFMGQDVNLKFQLGSDSSVNYPGWYLTQVKVGGTVVATEQETWGTIKALYR